MSVPARPPRPVQVGRRRPVVEHQHEAGRSRRPPRAAHASTAGPDLEPLALDEPDPRGASAVQALRHRRRRTARRGPPRRLRRSRSRRGPRAAGPRGSPRRGPGARRGTRWQARRRRPASSSSPVGIDERPGRAAAPARGARPVDARLSSTGAYARASAGERMPSSRRPARIAEGQRPGAGAVLDERERRRPAESLPRLGDLAGQRRAEDRMQLRRPSGSRRSAGRPGRGRRCSSRPRDGRARAP